MPRGRGDSAVTPVSYLETGVLYCEDNLRQLSQFPDECIDLIYIDPPFFSNRHYEVIWGDEAEVRSFEDRWAGGINNYIDWMRERVIELQRVLKPTGTIYLHCDWHAGHYLKVMMDEIFGMKQFLNEIVWHYESASGAPKKWLHKNHDTIFRYASTRADLVTWHHPLKPWPESTLKKWQRDEEGRIYHAQNKRNQRYYINPEGKLDDDVWDITFTTRTKERLGYPTQKPEELLEKIVRASSDEGDIVLDPFCGCGTTVAVADRLNRHWIGIDISQTAVRLMERRLIKQSHGACRPKLVGMPVTAAELRALKPFEFQNWVIQRFHGTHSPRKSGDMGIDGFAFMTHDPIQVKQSERVGRNVVDNFETAMKRVGKDKGYIVAFSFTKGAREEVARARWSEHLDIHLLTVDQLVAPAPTVQTPLFPEPASVVELPLLPPRAASERPSARELIENNRKAAVG